jgi:integrase
VSRSRSHHSGANIDGKNPIHAAGRSGSSVRHSKEDALSDREFELLLEGARRLDTDYYYAPDPEFVIYTLGRLGLRRGELAHLTEEWIDWRREMIQIPTHEGCTKGKGGDVCGYCQQLARQRAELNDELGVEEAKSWMWVPKTEAASRDVYFGWDARAKMYVERYFASPEYDRVEIGSNAINRRVKRAAEEAEELDPDL